MEAKRFVTNLSEDSWLWANLNGSPLWMPAPTLRTMHHCLHPNASGGFDLLVETAHLKWMMERLGHGGTFLDVGCATGATTLPIAHQFGPEVSIVAYEPSESARKLLISTLERNRTRTIDLRPVAVSDTKGTAEFREFLPDETGTTPWQSETSTLMAPVISDAPHKTMTVPVLTLDDDALPRCKSSNVVVKIDVEGFETKVLAGARNLLAQKHPALSIDIHIDPFGDGKNTTEHQVRSILGNLGYRWETCGHVLLCDPRR